MKHIFLFSAALLLTALHTDLSAQIRIGGRNINAAKAIQAGSDVVKAITLSDADIARLSKEAVDWMDENNPVADETTEYGARLKKLTEHIQVDGLPLNFKVYDVIDVNAFACGDGSIRVFSSLMDLMTDDELMAIIGHEIGHVVHTDVKDAMKNAYLASAARCRIGRRKHRRETLEFPIGGTDHRFHQRTVLAKTGEPGRRLRFRFLHCEQRRSLCDVECAEQTRGTFQIGGR